ncbi:MAG: hydrolase [Archaeoglobaceae archaeon]|nr:hydrolase [Archaeoglobales archaeon]MDI9642671.1 hydrolase [Archaeoglobales archaeon]
MRFEDRLVLSAMAGINNAEFCKTQKASLVILGGFNADKGAMEAGKKVAERGRKEFIFEDPLEGIEKELRKIKGRKFAVNVRSSTLEGYIETSRLVESYGGILEINAHCRQPEFISARCGEWLLFNPYELFKTVEEVSKITITAVKIRGGYELDYEKLSAKLFEKGCEILHVDAMTPGGGCDLSLIQKVSKHGFTIGNNSFVDIRSGENMIKAGAKMVSAARAVLKDRNFFEKMLKSVILSEPVELSRVNFI